MTDQQKNGHGGSRSGAGRPKGDSRLYSFRIEGKYADYIDQHTSKTDFIKQCVREAYDVSPEGEVEALRSVGEATPAMSIKPFSLPFYDNVKVVAGFPIPLNNDEMAQEVELLRLLCPNPEASYLIRVKGDSMIEAGIHDGDIIIVDRSKRSPSGNEVAMCELNGEYTIKHVEREGKRAWLVPANPDYPRIEIKEGDDFSVWGTVTYTIHRPR